MPTTTLPAVTLVNAPGKDIDVLVVGLAQVSGTDVLVGVPDDVAASLAKAFGRPLEEVVRDLGGSSKNSENPISRSDLVNSR